jgi:CP family cyanate transporter-like MFS transporter
MRSQGGLAVLVMALTVGSFLGLLTLPLAWQWVLAALLGMGMGGAFSLAIMMIVLRAPDGPTAAMLSSMAQGVGYTLASAGPLIVGLLHDMTGDWRGAAGLFVVASLGAAVAGGLAGRRRMVGMQVG